jgi:hypothetical protein
MVVEDILLVRFWRAKTVVGEGVKSKLVKAGRRARVLPIKRNA